MPLVGTGLFPALYQTVDHLAEMVELSLQAFNPDVQDKVVSALTKRKQQARAIHSLKEGSKTVKVLSTHLDDLKSSANAMQRNMTYTNKSHTDLIEQLDHVSGDLDHALERLRHSEAEKLSLSSDMQAARAQIADLEASQRTTEATLLEREAALETAQFSLTEVDNVINRLEQEATTLRQSTAEAEERAAQATGVLDEIKGEADKAVAQADKHREVISKLTADNLVFVMQLKQAEAELATANKERASLKLAVEQQKGPWFDTVRAGIESRVREALQRVEVLEKQLEVQQRQHQDALQAVQQVRAPLKKQLSTTMPHLIAPKPASLEHSVD